MRSILTSILALTFCGLYGQFDIKGYVLSEHDNDAIVGATVQIEQNGQAVIADLDGLFIFEDLANGTYTLTINSVGYHSASANVTLDGQSEEVIISMQEKIIDLPDVVIESVTMTGGLAGVKKSLGSAHFIGQKEIQKFSYTDINRTLRNIPGANIQEEDGYGLRPNIGLRATGSERSSKITVMEDGILAAPAPYAAPAAYYFPTVGRMEAIEIMKGSSQIKYGPFTTGGAINLISTPLPTKFAGHADFIYGSDNYKMLHANLGNAHKNVSYMVETLQYSADGFKQLDNGGNTGFNKEDYLAKLRFNTNPNAKIYQSVSFKYGRAEESSNETYLGLTDNDFESTPLRRYSGSQVDNIVTNQEQFSITHFAELASFLDVHTSLYRNDFARNWYKLDKVNGLSIANILDQPEVYSSELNIIRGDQDDTSDALYVKANNRSYYSQGIQSNFVFHFNASGIKQKIDLGVRYHKDQIDRFQWADTYNIVNGIMQLSNSGVPGTESNRVSDARALATYLQYKLEMDKVTITAGLRNENIRIERQDFGKEDPNRTGSNLSERSNEVSIWIPGLAASYQYATQASIFGGVHKGFAPPGSKEGTEPEESWNLELGWRIDKNGFNGQILGYYNVYDNLLGSDLAASGGAGTQDLFNGGAAIARGIEAQAQYNITTDSRKVSYPIHINYTFSEAYFNSSFESDFDAWGDVEQGDRLPYVPRHQIAAGIGIEHQQFLFDVSARHSSAMLTQAGSFESQVARTDEAFTIDIALNYKLSKELSAFVNINNATNNLFIVSRRPAGVRPNQPRVFNVGLKANF